MAEGTTGDRTEGTATSTTSNASNATGGVTWVRSENEVPQYRMGRVRHVTISLGAREMALLEQWNRIEGHGLTLQGLVEAALHRGLEAIEMVVLDAEVVAGSFDPVSDATALDTHPQWSPGEGGE